MNDDQNRLGQREILRLIDGVQFLVLDICTLSKSAFYIAMVSFNIGFFGVLHYLL